MFLKPKKHIRQANVSEIFIYSLITVFFAFGVIYGVKNASGISNAEIFYGDGKIGDIVLRSVMSNSRIIVWICIFSLSLVGIPGILYFDYLKGYNIGMSLFSIISSSQTGTFKALLSTLPYIILNISAIVLISKKGISLSGEIFGSYMGRTYKKNCKSSLTSFMIVIMISIILEVFAGISEILIKTIIM